MGYLLLGMLGVVAYVVLHGHYPHGKGPFDALPAGLPTRSAAERLTAPTSGLKYDVYTWPPLSTGLQYHVAVLADHLGWVSYWVDRKQTNAELRSYASGFAADGSPSLDVMRKDFGV